MWLNFSTIIIFVFFIGFNSFALGADSLINYKFEYDVLDNSGFDNNGYVAGTSKFTDGIDGQAFDFDGATVINQGDTSSWKSMHDGSSYSISFWAKSDNISNTPVLVDTSGGGSVSSVGMTMFTRGDGSINFQLVNGGGTGVVTSLGTPPYTFKADGLWHHYVVTYDETLAFDNAKLYVDGVLITKASKSQNPSTLSHSKNLTIGGLTYSNKFIGDMDDFKVFNIALDEDQVNTVFKTQVNFLQNNIVLNHSDILVIKDPSIPVNISNETMSKVESYDQHIWVVLYRIEDSDIFQSNFINFTSGNTDDGISQKLNVRDGATVNVIYNGMTFPSIAIIQNSDNLLPSSYDSTKTFTVLANQGCPNDSIYGGDSDADGICDNWEKEENSYRINYPDSSTYKLPCDTSADYTNDPLGTNICPSLNIKDIYIEIDYIAGHAPNIEALKQVVSAFLNAPEPIHLHIVIDKQILPHINTIHFPGGVSNHGFDQIKAKEFGTDAERNDNWENNELAKAQVFYYYLWAHDQANDIGSSGTAEAGGNDGTVTLGSFDGSVGTTDQQAGTFMHELGHNLGLDHGGDFEDADNCKPNLLSVMSYSRQFSDLLPNRTLDYSRAYVDFPTDPYTLGMENTPLPNQISQYPEDTKLIYGIGNGAIGFTTPGHEINWPSDWTQIRHIKDSNDNDVCPPTDPTQPVELDSVNQWSIIDLSVKNAHWREGRSSSNLSTNNNLSVETTKTEYLPEEDVIVRGNTTSAIPNFVNVKIIASSSSLVSGEGESSISNNSFIHSFKGISPYPAYFENYIVEVTHGNVTTSTVFHKGIDSSPFNLELDDSKWCLTEQEARSLFDKQYGSDISKQNLEAFIEKSKSLQLSWITPGGSILPAIDEQMLINENDVNKQNFLKYAPLCSTSYSKHNNDIDMNIVRAARSVNVDNVKVIIENLNDTKSNFVNSEAKTQLLNELETIRTYVLNDQMIDALYGYMNMTYSVNQKITNTPAKQEILAVLDRNIESTSHTVPEFATITFMILIISISSIIVLSNRSFNIMNFK